LPEEGEIVSYHEKHLSDFGLQGIGERIEFLQGDAHNLKPQFSNYDLILAANLLDRLYDPARFLSAIHQRLKIGGLLVLVSPYTWLEEYTRKENWLGGIRRAGEPYTTLEGLHDLLEAHFRPVQEPQDVEFVIRETARKYQHSVSQLTIWERSR
jgi:putative 4-mercaptohistidine N1-methyltranferase